MVLNFNYLLVITTSFISVCTAIRVDWNTNTGPIIPPIPRTTVRPQPLFKEPAPVWEDLSNDIPNPNPYIYVLPPPSRPKQHLHTNVNYEINSETNYGTIVTPSNTNTYYQENNNLLQVASLSPQYVPNVGTRYVAVVSKSSKTTSPQSNAFSTGDKTSYKLQGKYNAKTKKYKAYEKVKYVPLNYTSKDVFQSLWFSQYEQKLPVKEMAQQWSSPFSSKDTTNSPNLKVSKPIFTKIFMKDVYAKDAVTPKQTFNRSVDKAEKS